MKPLLTLHSSGEFPDLVADGRAPVLQEIDERIPILSAAALVASDRAIGAFQEAEQIASLALDLALLASKFTAAAERWAHEAKRYALERERVELEALDRASDGALDEAAE